MSGATRLSALLGIYLLLQGAAFASVCSDATVEKDPGKKIQLYTKCINSKQFPSYDIGEIYCERGVEFANTKQLEKAIEDFSMCIKMRPTALTGYYNRAKAYNQIGTPEKAKPDMNFLMRVASNSPQVVNLCGDINHTMKRYDDAIKNYTKLISMLQHGRATTKKDLANAYRDRAIVLSEKNDFAHAVEDMNTVISIIPDYSYYYSIRGSIYFNQGAFDKAKEDFQQAVRLDANNKGATENLKKLTEGTPQALNIMGRAETEARQLVEKGDYAQAIRKLKVAMANGEKAFGDNLLGYKDIIVLLAGMYDMLWQYNASLPLYKSLLQFSSEVYGSESPEATLYMAAMANIYTAIGDPEQARKLLQQIITMQENSFEPDLQAWAGELHNLAMTELSLGDYDVAKKHLDKAYAFKKRILGEDDLATILTQLGYARYYMMLGKYDQAEPLLLQELKLLKNVDIPVPHYEAEVMMDLAEIKERDGDIESAERYLKESLKIKENILGKDSDTVAGTLQTLGRFSARRGDSKTALELMLRSQTLMDKFIDRIMGFTTEKQQLTFLASQHDAMEELLSLVDRNLTTDKDAVRQCFDIWLRRKGLVLETQKQFQQVLFSSKDPNFAKLLDELRAVRANISYTIISGPKDDTSKEEYQKRLERLEARQQALEEELASKNRSTVPSMSSKEVRAEAIARLLPEGSAMVEFARTGLPSFDLKKAQTTEKAPAHYLAFVLPARNVAGLVMVDLGVAEDIEKTQTALRQALSHPTEADPRDPDTVAAVSKASNALYKLVFSPLRQALGAARHVYLSPDGALNLLPFEVLQDEGGRYLIEDFTFTYLAAGRDVLGFGHKGGKAGKNLIIGNPDFNLDGNTKQNVLKDLHLTRSASSVDSLSSRERRGLYFGPLPNTQQEVDAIRRILGEENSEFFTGKEAVEELLTSRTAPGILHLATHGFFLPDQQLPRVVSGKIADRTSQGGKAEHFENPLVRSGLALAGANTAVKAETASSGDGLVTAEKLLGLNLEGTRLVVLSACESGVGEIRSGEGVFGLRRAFALAGARSQVMSMWPVPDAQTIELMQDFYTKMQSDAANPSVALRQAALDMLEATRKQYGNTNPFFWGAFVFLGDDGTIIAPVVAAPKSVSPAAASSDTAVSSVSRHEEIERFMEDFFKARSLNASDTVLDFYAEKVNFFKLGNVGKTIIKKNLDYFSNRWPVRTMTIMGISTGFNNRDKTYEVSVAYKYTTQNATSQKKGVARDIFMLKQNGHSFSIISEKNSAIDRK